ncbi:response regulator transcription factor [Coraliomargarita algicola]|uniref:Response regulator transcription factor n=1 Tax=Coraliomargarita algicola TaxID=3092156 RepID=A0ABZ0RIC6_9BACT|nr:response regulator transcription factor [Coraliomargarita sp. J2-16]WPJ95955.1 response regulator transcription factor [Coraliomargarita sp. J2-16]
MLKQIKLMLVEDSPEYRTTITMAVKKEEDIELISQYSTAEEALRKVEGASSITAPEIVLLDLNLPGMSGNEALPWFKKYIPKTKVIVLTQSNQEADVLAAISAGASGYLLKGATRKEIFDGIRSVNNGGAMIDPAVAQYILKQLKSSPKDLGNTKALSSRELEILTLLGDGLVQKEISARLNITNNTVGTHLRRIYEKLEVQNAPAAINKAYKRGLLPG